MDKNSNNELVKAKKVDMKIIELIISLNNFIISKL